LGLLLDREEPSRNRKMHRLSVLAFGLLYERAALRATLTLRGVGADVGTAVAWEARDFPVVRGVRVVHDGLENDSGVRNDFGAATITEVREAVRLDAKGPCLGLPRWRGTGSLLLVCEWRGRSPLIRGCRG
jgi:hypothetical protein